MQLAYRPWFPEGTANPLTDREREVALAASRGMQTEQIAAYMGLAIGTIRTHKSHIRSKLKVHTMAGAVSLCLRRGWIS